MSDAAQETLQAALEACLLALNERPSFPFRPAANPLGLKVDGRGFARSYDLAAKVQEMLKTEGKPK